MLKILIENLDNITPENEEQPKTTKRNIANVFDITAIKQELLNQYEVQIKCRLPRMWSDDIRYMIIEAPYIGKVRDLLDPPRSTEVALFVDYSNETAFAMPRGGADKQTMMLISSIANKHINSPYKCDKSIRYKLHSKGGEL